MALQTQQLERTFRYNSVDLLDPGAQYTPEQVRDFYAPTYPEILNAAIEGPDEKDGKLQYTFRRAVGTKGVSTILGGAWLGAALRGEAWPGGARRGKTRRGMARQGVARPG